MMGHKTFQPKRLYAFSVEDRMPADHLVAAVIDFSFVRHMTARLYSHTGQPGIDPYSESAVERNRSLSDCGRGEGAAALSLPSLNTTARSGWKHLAY
jgi:hypothetical protein